MEILFHIVVFIFGLGVGLAIGVLTNIFRDLRTLKKLEMQIRDAQDRVDGYCMAQDEYIADLKWELKEREEEIKELRSQIPSHQEV